MSDPIKVTEHMPPIGEYVTFAEVQAAAGQADLAILPDRVGADEKGRWVAFVSTAQELRVALAGAGSVVIARPEGARATEYSQHDAAILLPVLLEVGRAGVGLLDQALIAWVKSKFAKHPEQTVIFRWAKHEPDSDGFEIIDAEGAASDIAELIRAARGESVPPG